MEQMLLYCVFLGLLVEKPGMNFCEKVWRERFSLHLPPNTPKNYGQCLYHCRK